MESRPTLTQDQIRDGVTKILKVAFCHVEETTGEKYLPKVLLLLLMSTTAAALAGGVTLPILAQGVVATWNDMTGDQIGVSYLEGSAPKETLH